jgi:Fe-S oxidoreductase
MHKSGYSLQDPAFWSPEDLDHELRRVAQVCNGCRLCYNLCPSFPALFNTVDERDPERSHAEGALLAEGAPMAEEDAAHALRGVKVSTANPIDRLGSADLGRVVDLCYNCKLCFPICPYVPPHEFAVDFPRLMLRAKAVKAKEEGVTLQDKFLGATDLLGSVMTKLPVLSNWANHNSFNRMLMEQTVGIHRDRQLPDWTGQTFEAWWAERRETQGEGPSRPLGESAEPAAAAKPRAVLFFTCFLNYNDPEVAQAAVEVLERSGVEVAVPELRCCGMPSLDGGDVDQCLVQARDNIDALLPYVRAGYAIVSPGPTCTFMLRQEYAELLQTAEARQVGAAVRDLSEYLVELKRAGKLNRTFGAVPPRKVALHFPCHLKVQKIGYRSKDLLELVPGTEVELIDRCCGMDGTWGMKKEYFELSLQVAAKATEAVKDAAPAPEGGAPAQDFEVASDCPLAALQLKQTTARKVRHPILLLRDAYRAADGGGTPKEKS